MIHYRGYRHTEGLGHQLVTKDDDILDPCPEGGTPMSENIRKELKNFFWRKFPEYTESFSIELSRQVCNLFKSQIEQIPLLSGEEIQNILGFEIPKNAEITSITLNRGQLYALIQAQKQNILSKLQLKGDKDHG